MNGGRGDRPFRPVLEALELLLERGAVAELRAIGADGRVSSGYFDSPEGLASAAEALDATGDCSGVYVTLNPVHPALLARRANRVQARLGRKDATTADADIARRRWLPIDVDPARPSGVSSTADEHEAAQRTARAIRNGLADLGWPAPVVADSGNGAHLLYRVDLPNDDDSTALVRAVLGALAARFSTDEAKVDRANFNAARIWKVYGTVGRKGDSTQDRPHRRAALVARPFELEVVPAELLRALAAPEPPAAAPTPEERAGLSDLRAWFEGHGIAVAGEKPWHGGTLYTLAQCPFSDAHTDGAYAVRFSTGAVHAGCKHDSCGGGRQRWQELRARLEPGHVPPPAGAGPSPPPPTAVAEPPDPSVAAKAREVLEGGDPVAYFLDCFGEDHVGDRVLARCLIASIASQTIRNTKGLHVYVTGESGKGKSSGMTAMLRQVPEESRLAERMSNKALYYSDDINPGTVLLLDDIALSEELQEVLKESTSKYTERIRMRAVNKDRKVQHFSIPERCAWWLANVSALYGDQVLNRMLIAWVDDSEEQDREVFRRKAENEEREGDEPVEDRFELRVCREMWRVLRGQGLVYVRIPFARRIRMASVRNRRNPDFLYDLVRSCALVNLFSRERRTLRDGRLSIMATEEDFSQAAALFAELHATGGSLTSKFDRNEQLVLSLASHYRAEQFTVQDVQGWTGWNYQKSRRILLGYESRGNYYPGLLDKSGALSLVEEVATEEGRDGRDVKRRSLVFTFDEEVYRRERYEGQVWLEETESISSFGRRGPADRPAERAAGGRASPGSENGADSARNDPAGFSSSGQDAGAGVSGEAACPACTAAAERAGEAAGAPGGKAGSGDDAQTRPLSAERPAAETAERPGIDPRRFAALDGPAWEACSACGTTPSHYRELRGARLLCRRCHGAAVRREQAAVAPLPRVIPAGSMKRVTASVGRCDVCDLEAAAWKGEGVRLCEACYRRELRRAVEAGEGVAAEG